MATYSDKFSSGWATLYLVVTTESQSITNNTSYLKCVLKIKKNSSCSSYNNGGASISMTVAGTKLYSSSSFNISSLSVGSTKTLATKYITVSHNSDGTKSVSCKANFSSGVSLGSASISNTYACATIPRASTFTLSSSSVDVEKKIIANISRKSTSFTHTVKFYITGCETSSSSDYCKIYTGIGTSKEFTIPKGWYSKLESSESITAYCKVITKNSSGSQIGDSVSKSFTVKVPSSIKPSITSITLSVPNIKIGDNTYTGLIQNISSLTINVIGSPPSDGAATIKSYTYSGPGISITKNNSKENSSATTDKIPNSGTLSYKVTIKDSRGREASMTTAVSCIPYFVPNFTKNLSANREGDGSKIRCKFSLNYTSINDYNKICQIDILYKEEGKQTQSTKTFTDKVGSNGVFDGNYLLEGLNKDLKYDIQVKVTDLLSGSSYSNKVSVRGSVKIFNVTESGTGIAFGKMATENELVESVYPIKAPNITPTCLFENIPGLTGTIPLNDSAENYTYFEIFYHDNVDVSEGGSGYGHKSIKVYQPNNKSVSLMSVEPNNVNTNPRMYFRSSGWHISGNTLTPGNANGNNKCTLAYIEDTGATYLSGEVKNYDPTEGRIYITRVNGYK